MNRNCAICGTPLTEAESYPHDGKSLCEDCFLDAQTITRTCDPWAVYTASRTVEQQESLTPLQAEIMQCIKTNGPLPVPVLCRHLGIGHQDLERNFTPLRHMQLVRAFRQDGQMMVTLFRD